MKDKKCIILPLSILMVVLFAGNMAFNYFVVSERVAEQVAKNNLEMQYESFWGKENYQKAMMVQKAQIKAQFDPITMEDLKKQLEWQTWNNQPQVNEWETKEQKVDVSTLDKKYIKWNPDAPFTIFEHSDFNCPYCKRFHDSGVVNKLLEDYKDKINYVYVNRPVIGGENSMMKAKSMLCAGEMWWADVYHKLADKFFTNTINTREDIVWFGKELWIDTTKFWECIDSDTYDAEIQKTISVWNEFGISGTPGSLMVNNKTWEYVTVKWAAPYANFKTALDWLMSK